MAIDSGHPPARALLESLLDLSRQEQALLREEQWEAAVVLRSSFDELYATFERVADEDPLAAADVPVLQQLIDSHGESMRMAQVLQAKAGSALAAISEAVPIGKYAPMGSAQKAGSRFVDHEA